MLTDPESVKIHLQRNYLFTLLGATGVKAVRKYVGEIDTWLILFAAKEIKGKTFKKVFKNNECVLS